MTDPTETILFETSPYGTLDGIVEHDGSVIYFYLNGRSANENAGADAEDRFGTRACWVRNLERGPMVISKKEMAQGKAPMMPRNDCVDSELVRLPKADDLRIVWFEEGNGAALLESDSDGDGSTTIAVIPPWSGVEGFHGYALNCAHETPLAWPMPENPSLGLRIERAREFWNSFTQESTPFAQLQPQLLQVFDDHFGANKRQSYYSIDGGKFPQRGLVHYADDSETVLLTAGMSMCPQPAVEMFVDQPAEYRRVELGVRFPHDENGPNAERIESLIRALGSFASYPWSNWTWLGPGHTVGWSDSASGSGTLERDQLIKLPKFRDDPIHLLWINS